MHGADANVLGGQVLKDENTRLGLEHMGLAEKIKENKEKIKLGNQLPYLVGNIVEILDVSPDDEEVGTVCQGADISMRCGKSCVLWTLIAHLSSGHATVSRETAVWKSQRSLT